MIKAEKTLRIRLLALTISAACFASCTSSTEIPTISPIESAIPSVSDTVSIYCQIMPKFGEERPLILLQDKTELRLYSGDSIDEDMDIARNGLTDGRHESIFQDFKNKNRGPEPLVDQIACEGTNIQIIKSEKLAEMFKKDDAWGKIRKVFPGRPVFVVVSEIGFNESNDRALVFMHWYRGSLYGSGDYYLMVKQGSEWRIAKEANKWVS